MTAQTETQDRADRFARRNAAGPVVFGLLLFASPGNAQQYVGQDGRLLDANPQVGGSRYNFDNSRPLSPLVGGNPFATGNIGRGFSLRSFSPIRSTTAFRAPLGSGTLSAFRRDSISVADRSLPLGGLLPRAFFDPVLTAPTGGYLQGYYGSEPTVPAFVPGLRNTQAAEVTDPFGQALPYGSPPVGRSDFDKPARVPLHELTAPFNTELSSTIFGVQPTWLPGRTLEPQLESPSLYGPEAETGVPRADGGRAIPEGIQQPLDLRTWPETSIQAPTPLDVLSQDAATRLLTERTTPTLSQPGESVDTGEEATASWYGAGMPSATGAAPLRDTSMLPGQDVFTDMRLALELSLNPQAEWYTEMWEATRSAGGAPPTDVLSEDPTHSIDKQTRAVQAAADFLTRMFEAPVETFVGGGASAANEELRKAEEAMDAGRYYDAVRNYERVRVLDPANPLPLIGKGHALLAAGEYVSAAFNLVAGLERFPELARFQFDLSALMGGGEIVDIRRADLMQQLERNEDPQLRFLLGYLEFHAGRREIGMQNLKQAAGEAPPGSPIRRYPELMRLYQGIEFPFSPLGDFPDFPPADVEKPETGASAPGKEPE